MNKLVLLLTLGALLAGCTPKNGSTQPTSEPPPVPALDPLAVVLAPVPGQCRPDAEIAKTQQQIRDGRNVDAALEQLGWLFVTKARESLDSGFYKLAEQCALALQARPDRRLDALLLRGHVLQSLHRFKEAEPLALELVAERGRSFDYGLLGDIEVDLGDLNAALAAYQQMIDLKPDPRGYTRAAHLRWLKGDSIGAVELMRMAVRGASPRDAEAGAWMNTRLAQYLWQTHVTPEAARALDTALEFQNDYAPALLLRGRMLLAESRIQEALPALREAARVNPLPEPQWVLAEALQAAGQADEARLVRSQLAERGAAADARTYALYLATRGEQVETAVRLAERELQERADIFTHDALAWALTAAGRLDRAQEHMACALGEGTQDARLCCHAAVLYSRTGCREEARRWYEKAEELKALLLPSELDQLDCAPQQIALAQPQCGDSAIAAAASSLSHCDN